MAGQQRLATDIPQSLTRVQFRSSLATDSTRRTSGLGAPGPCDKSTTNLWLVSLRTKLDLGQSAIAIAPVERRHRQFPAEMKLTFASSGSRPRGTVARQNEHKKPQRL